jgi:mono/diheme cytochrome c family protein
MRTKRTGLRRLALAGLGVATLTLGGCTRVEEALSAVPMFNFMRQSPALDPWEGPRPAPPGAVPYRSPAERFEPMVEQTEAALRAWGDTLTNPLPMSDGVLVRGAEVYRIYCQVCHGPEGHGDGPIVGPGLYPFALDLTLPQTVGRTDGYLYAVTRLGRGLMPAYRRIPPSDRWAVVIYMRQLQQGDAQQPPAEAPEGAAEPGDGAEPEDPAADQTTVQGQE